MKKSFCLAFVLTSLVVLCLTGGCKVDVETPDYNLHTVTFECNGGSRISPQILVNGTTATEPKDPTKHGLEFLGWYADPQFNTSFDFGTPITQDVTVYAKWVYKVYFVDYDGHALKSVDVVHGNKVSRPDKESLKSWKLHNHYSDCFLESEYGIDDEYKSHLNGNYCLYDNLLDEWYDSFDWYDYCDWYDDKTWLETFDFEKPILDSEAIYAGYKPWVVTFECNGGSEVSPQKISGGKTVSRPENPTKDGYAFDGWYSDAACNSKYDFTNEVWEPKTLYAKWHEFKITKYKELPAGTDGTAGSSWTYVEFGDWPQTIKAENVTVDENESVEVGMFTYYKGSDGAWYVKEKERRRNGPLLKYSDGTVVAVEGMNSYKYFKVEPIKWRVLTSDYNGKKLLLAEDILSCYCWLDYNGVQLHNSGYYLSCLRAFLNGTIVPNQSSFTTFRDKGFLQTAFPYTLKESIVTSEFDNLERSSNPNFDSSWWRSRGYSVNTDNGKKEHFIDDLIFTLGVQEVTTEEFGFVDNESRQKVISDYAKTCGYDGDTSRYVIDYRTEFLCSWWLRSSLGSSDKSPITCYVSDSGAWSNLNPEYCTHYNLGVVPALCVEN